MYDFTILILPGDLQKLRIVSNLHSSERGNKELIKARSGMEETTQLTEAKRKEYYNKSKEQEHD
jgi:hypothetical protein